MHQRIFKILSLCAAMLLVSCTTSRQLVQTSSLPHYDFVSVTQLHALLADDERVTDSTDNDYAYIYNDSLFYSQDSIIRFSWIGDSLTITTNRGLQFEQYAIYGDTLFLFAKIHNRKDDAQAVWQHLVYIPRPETLIIKLNTGFVCPLWNKRNEYTYYNNAQVVDSMYSGRLQYGCENCAPPHGYGEEGKYYYMPWLIDPRTTDSTKLLLLNSDATWYMYENDSLIDCGTMAKKWGHYYEGHNHQFNWVYFYNLETYFEHFHSLDEFWCCYKQNKCPEGEFYDVIPQKRKKGISWCFYDGDIENIIMLIYNGLWIDNDYTSVYQLQYEGSPCGWYKKIK